MGRRAIVAFAVVLAFLGLGVGDSLAGPSGASSSRVRYSRARELANGMQGNGHVNGQAKPGHGPSPNMTFHGGSIIHGIGVHPIFWGTSWGNAGFVSDKISGIASFYAGVGGSAYAGTNTEYSGSNGQVTSAVSSGASITDTSAGPSGGPTTTQILNEVKKYYPSPTAGDYYPVYIDGTRGNAGYCAWHSYGSINGTTVEIGFFFNLDGDPGCDPADSWTTHSQGLKALANVSGHELSEVLTDPILNAWYDQQGAENADKCAWTFHSVITFKNGSQWKIQGNWSNAAYNARSGYAKYGCIDGN
jgi:hypothetical protein